MSQKTQRTQKTQKTQRTQTTTCVRSKHLWMRDVKLELTFIENKLISRIWFKNGESEKFKHPIDEIYQIFYLTCCPEDLIVEGCECSLSTIYQMLYSNI